MKFIVRTLRSYVILSKNWEIDRALQFIAPTTVSLLRMQRIDALYMLTRLLNKYLRVVSIGLLGNLLCVLCLTA